jgi:hypothetical protein
MRPAGVRMLREWSILEAEAPVDHRFQFFIEHSFLSYDDAN